MKDEIERRLQRNLERVRSLIAAYRAVLPGASGRPSVATTDILRASVVFLHASLEDVIRSLLEWKLPLAKAEHLKDVPLDGSTQRSFTLADLTAHRGRTVDEVIEAAVMRSLERSNFNSVAEVARALERADVDTKVLSAYASNLEAMMKRRHWIVHRADRNQMQGQGQFEARSLAPDTVQRWVDAVEAFGAAVLLLV